MSAVYFITPSSCFSCAALVRVLLCVALFQSLFKPVGGMAGGWLKNDERRQKVAPLGERGCLLAFSPTLGGRSSQVSDTSAPPPARDVPFPIEDKIWPREGPRQAQPQPPCPLCWAVTPPRAGPPELMTRSVGWVRDSPWVVAASARCGCCGGVGGWVHGAVGGGVFRPRGRRGAGRILSNG